MKPNQNNILREIKDFVFSSWFVIRHTVSEWQECWCSSHAGCSWGEKAHKPHRALLTAAISQSCFVSDLCSRKGLGRGEPPIIFITEEVQIPPVLSLFHIKMSGYTEEKDETFRWGSKTRLTVFRSLLSSSEIPYLSALSSLLGVCFIQYWPVAVVVI